MRYSNSNNNSSNNSKYLIIGNGKLAKHIVHYFQLLDVPIRTWSRGEEGREKISLIDKARGVETVLILINDSEIESFIKKNSFLVDKTLIHFSGAIFTDLAYGAHPLMTFGEVLYTLDFYQKIPFVTDFKGLTFQELFPEFSNPSYPIDPAQKAYYHALCGIAGNFTSILWQKCFSEFKTKFSIERETLFPYMEAIFKNLMMNPEKALTGPFERKDFSTISKHLQALKNNDFLDIYKAFLKMTFKENEFIDNAEVKFGDEKYENS